MKKRQFDIVTFIIILLLIFAGACLVHTGKRIMTQFNLTTSF